MIRLLAERAAEKAAKAARLSAGNGWEFCDLSDAKQWYDFGSDVWKEMGAAGQFQGGCQVFRRLKKIPDLITKACL